MDWAAEQRGHFVGDAAVCVEGGLQVGLVFHGADMRNPRRFRELYGLARRRSAHLLAIVVSRVDDRQRIPQLGAYGLHDVAHYDPPRRHRLGS